MANLPDAASLTRTIEIDKKIEEIAMRHPGVGKVVSLTGFSFTEGVNRTTSGSNYIVLKDWKQRKGANLHADQILQDLTKDFSTLSDANIFVFNPPAIPGLGTAGGFEIWLENRGERGNEALQQAIDSIIAKAKQRPELLDLHTEAQFNNLQFYVDVDRYKTRMLGVTITDVFEALQTLVGAVYINNFNKFGRIYQVIVQAEPEFREKLSNLGDMYVRSDSGNMVPLKSLISIRPSKGPNLISRFNDYPAAHMFGGAAPGYSSGQAIQAMEEIAKEVLPPDITYEWSGAALNQLIDEALANNQDIKVAIARVDEFQAQLGIVRSQLYPQIEFDGSGDRQKNSTTISSSSSGQQILNAYNTVFNASYLVDLWGQIRSAVDASYHEWLASIEARRIVVVAIVSSVADTYVQLRQFDQQLIVAQKTLEDRNRYYYLAKVRFDLGLTSEMPVEQALTEIEVAEADVENFQIAIAHAENLLSTLIGTSSIAIQRGAILDQLSMPPAVPICLPSNIINQRPDLRAAEQQLMAAGAQIGVARSLFFPQITLSGSFGYQSRQLNTLLSNPSKIWEYGANILQEIFTGGRLTSNLRLTEAQQRESLHGYLSTLLKAFQEVNDALISHKINLELVETQRRRVEATQNYLHYSDLLYQEGETDYLTFLDAEREFYRAQLDYETAKGNSFLSLIQIYQTLGGGWVFDADATAVSEHP